MSTRVVPSGTADPLRPRRAGVLPAVTSGAAVALVLLGGCAGSRSSASTSAASDPDSEWLEPSQLLALQIEEHAENVPYIRNVEEFTSEVEWFVRAGEAAYPKVLDLAGDPEPRIASFGLTVISTLRDARLAGPLQREVGFPADAGRDVQYGYARALLAMGDWSHVDVLVDALEDEDLIDRANAFQALRRATREDFGYHPQGDPEARAEAVERWREWLEARRDDRLLREPSRSPTGS